MNDGNAWKGPCPIEARSDSKYICQSECVLLVFGFREAARESIKILEGFSNKKDRDSEQQYSEYLSKYVKPPAPEHNK